MRFAVTGLVDGPANSIKGGRWHISDSIKVCFGVYGLISVLILSDNKFDDHWKHEMKVRSKLIESDYSTHNVSRVRSVRVQDTNTKY